MFLSSNDDALYDARNILNYFFKRPYGQTNPEPIILKELPLDDQVLILNVLCTYYDEYYSYNYKIFEKLAAALTKQDKLSLAKDVLEMGANSEKISVESAQNIWKSILDLNERISVDSSLLYSPSYAESIESLKYHISEKAMITYRIAELDIQIAEFTKLLIDYCELKIKNN